MSPKNSTRVGLAGSTNKRSITMTLTVTLDGKILPFQIIYGGKTDQSQVLTRSTIATLRKLSNIFTNCYTIRQWGEKKIGDADQYALLIWKVFHDQKTKEQKILNEYVTNNMTDYFQVLDLTVNKWVKDYMKQQFNEWFPTMN